MKNKQQILHKISEITDLFNGGNFQQALNLLNELEADNPNNKTLLLNKSGLLIDIGFGLKNYKIIRNPNL